MFLVKALSLQRTTRRRSRRLVKISRLNARMCLRAERSSQSVRFTDADSGERSQFCISTLCLVLSTCITFLFHLSRILSIRIALNAILAPVRDPFSLSSL